MTTTNFIIKELTLSAGFVENLSFLSPFSSNISTMRSAVHTANFFPSGDQATAVTLTHDSLACVIDSMNFNCISSTTYLPRIEINDNNQSLHKHMDEFSFYRILPFSCQPVIIRCDGHSTNSSVYIPHWIYIHNGLMDALVLLVSAGEQCSSFLCTYDDSRGPCPYPCSARVSINRLCSKLQFLCAVRVVSNVPAAAGVFPPTSSSSFLFLLIPLLLLLLLLSLILILLLKG